MKRFSWLLVLGGGYLAYRLLTLASSASSLTYRIKGIKFGGTDFSRTWFDISFAIVNPTPQPIAFKKFFGQVTYKGIQIAQIIKDGSTGDTMINAQAESILTLPVVVDHLSLLSSVKDVLNSINNGLPIELVLSGTLYVGNFNLPINEKFQFNQPMVSMNGVPKRKTRIGACECGIGTLM